VTADRFYAVLLRLYPASFRARFGDDMRRSFADDCARANAVGRRSAAAFWMRTMVEAFVYGIAERLRPAAGQDHGAAPAKGRGMTSGFFHDCRDAFRAWRATPLVSTVAVVSLALGIGANTALFSILNGLVLKPLPVQQPDALAYLDGGEWTNPIWEEIRARQHELFDGAFAWSGQRFNLADQGLTDMVPGAYASGDMFDVLGIHPSVGRLLRSGDDMRGGGPDGAVAVISDRLWHQRFDASPAAVGSRLSLDGIPFTIVGVMPPGFFGPDVGALFDVIVPLGDEVLIRGPESSLSGRQTWWLEIMVRRKAEQSLAQANAALRAAQPQIRAATLPASARGAKNFLAQTLSLIPAAEGHSTLRERYAQPLTIVMVVVGAVLLIACANIANLLLARSTARRRELVIRLALGASRARLTRLLMLESAMLACGGAALGLIVARIASALLVRQLGAAVVLDLPLDLRVLGFTAAVTAVTALLFGLAPAAGVLHTAPNEILKDHARTLTGDRRVSIRNALVILQVALSLALIVGAGLFLQTFASLATVPLGFDHALLVTADVNVQRSVVPASGRNTLFDRFREAAAAVPGVAEAALSRLPPVSGSGWNTAIEAETGPSGDERARLSWVNAVSPRFFATYGIQLVAGRDFTADDRGGAPPVAIVNEAFARKFLGGGNPVGREFRAQIGTPTSDIYQVVGLVSNAAYRRLREGMVPTVYIPLSQTPLNASISMTVRTSPALRGTIVSDLARALGTVDSSAAFTIRPFDVYLEAGVRQERLVAILSGFFGALALALAALGLYGVTSYGVSRRRAELGVRMALGAEPGGVVRLVLGRVGWLVGSGVVAGLALSWWASRFISGTLLYGITSHDMATFVSAAVVLISVSAAAAWLPARRAARIDPVHVLREP
jgi:putative ABC transport system permease protein